MSEFMFGVGRKPPTRRSASRIDKIARKHGFCFVEARLPGTGYQHWFAGPNRGFPFDDRNAEAIWAALEKAGLADKDGVITKEDK